MNEREQTLLDPPLEGALVVVVLQERKDKVRLGVHVVAAYMLKPPLTKGTFLKGDFQLRVLSFLN